MEEQSGGDINISEKIESNDLFNDLSDIFNEYKYEILLIIIILSVVFYKYFDFNDFKFKTNNSIISNQSDLPKDIWLYWPAPKDKTPAIIQLCIQLIYKFNPNYNIHLITNQNYKEFIKDENINKIIESKITYNYKSDLIKLYILYNYGGIFIEPTILSLDSFDWVNDKLIKENKQILLYKNNNYTKNENKPIYENWFIAAYKNNKNIKLILDNYLQYLVNGADKSYSELINDKNIDYQNYVNQSPYELLNLVMIKTLSDFSDITSNDCSFDNYTCKCNQQSHNVNEIYQQILSIEEFNQIRQNKLIHLGNNNLEHIIKYKLTPKDNCLLYHLVKST